MGGRVCVKDTVCVKMRHGPSRYIVFPRQMTRNRDPLQKSRITIGLFCKTLTGSALKTHEMRREGRIAYGVATISNFLKIYILLCRI